MEFLPDTFWEFVVFILILVVSAVTLKLAFTVKFDINRWSESRRKRLKERIRMTCPHASVSVTEKGVEIASDFHSPFGTTSWQCNRCGLRVIDGSIATTIMEDYSRDPQLYLSRLKKFDRLAKKL